MPRAVRLSIALVVGLWATPSARAQDGISVYGLEPPVGIREPIALLRDGKADGGVVRRLSEADSAAPYLRRGLGGLAGRPKRDALQALEVIESRAYARNISRATRWIRDGRFDLMAEFVSGCEDADAVDLIDSGCRVWSAIRAEAANITARELKPGQALPTRFRGRPAFPHLVGDPLTVDAGLLTWGIVRAGNCQLDVWERDASVVLIRGTLTDLPKPAGSIGFWCRSVGIVNNAMPLGQCDSSLIIADGDIALAGSVQDSVVIANGSIKLADSPVGGWPSHCVIAATGSVGPFGDGGGNLFHAGGVCHTLPKHTSGVREKQRSLPFGVRFLDPAEFGLTLAAQNGGVQVMGIVPGSVFARHGVEDADVILSADDKAVETVPDFRRALRRGVVQESVTLRIKRGTDRLVRIVFLDDVPVPTAPAPRPKS